MQKITHSIQPNRNFALWRYSVSHSQLLLRSNMDDELAARHEIYFKGVEFVHLPAAFIVNSIKQRSVEESDSSEIWYREDLVGATHFTLHLPRGLGFVVAWVGFYIEESQRDYSQPSSAFRDGVL